MLSFYILEFIMSLELNRIARYNRNKVELLVSNIQYRIKQLVNTVDIAKIGEVMGFNVELHDAARKRCIETLTALYRRVSTFA